MNGYKATDKDGKCQGYQFDLPKDGKPGEWHEHDGEIEMCKTGFHFCEYPSGPWVFYDAPGTRIFKIEAEDVDPQSQGYGTEKKRVCRRIRFLEEIIPDGNRNSGNYNSGDCNSGNRNSGDYNSGHCNSGNRNSGSGNSGSGNSGHCNSGDYNSGDYNSGDCNSGNRNSGDCNSGNRNSGDCNSGNRNSGDCNATNRASGFFCQEIQTVKVFDVDSGLTYDEFTAKFPNYYWLGELMLMQDEINFEDWKDLPGITPEKLKSLHAKHLEKRA